MTSSPIRWFNQREIDAALGVLFEIYPQNIEEDISSSYTVTIIKPDIIDYILNLEANNYCGNDVLCIAATIIRTIIKGHPLLDGNKRFGMMMGERFIDLNGYRIRTSSKDFEGTAINLATGLWDKNEVYHWLKKVSSKQPDAMKK